MLSQPQQLVGYTLARRTTIALIAAALAGTIAAPARAQQASDKDISLIYLKPDAGLKEQALSRVAGQIVVAPPGGKWFQSATKLKIAIFDANHARIAAAGTGDGGGFHIAGLAPGRYTLVTGAQSLKILSVPLRIPSGTPSQKTSEQGLMIYLHLKTDDRPDTVAPIRNMPLRAELLDRSAKDQNVRNELPRSKLRGILGRMVDNFKWWSESFVRTARSLT